jgi:hypothetical protein
MADDTPTYPPHVLRYGDAGKRLYDEHLRILQSTGDTEAQARATLADPQYWQIIVAGEFLHPTD